MQKIYKGQVNQLRQGLINQIKTTFINPEGEDVDIEFHHQFLIWMMEENTFTEDSMKVLYTVSGLKFIDGQCYLTGTTADFEDFDDLEIESIYDLYDLAHILDSLTQGQYKILTNG